MVLYLSVGGLMSLKTPLNQSLDIKCPKCNHKFIYNLNLNHIKEVNSNKNEKKQYEFLSYVICKNPLCNYDIELKGYIFESPDNTVNSIGLTKLK